MNIWLYWDNLTQNDTPNYIRLCFKSIIKHCKDKHSIYFLNKSNIGYYIDNIPKELYQIERDIFDNSIKGFLRRLNYKKRIESRIAIQLAYLRLRLLYKYGGLWLDSDCVTMSDYGDIEDALQQHEIVGLKKISHGDNHIANNFIASNKNSKRIKEIIEKQEYIIKQKKYIKWGEIGGFLLNKYLEDFNDILLLDEKKILPIPWQEADKFFKNEPLKLIENSDPFCCMLYNNIFPDRFKKKSLDELYNDNTLISKLFKKYSQ